ncbi:MAG: hypothetical protein HC882_07810, partial [Acidobacteria bacterium]|nr:hypothetical protein [Acidobacteriota bacterium]
DDVDACPDVPGLPELKGCPDRDGDGITDALDKCPDVPEDRDGNQDDDGCPETEDRDGDGVMDPDDGCPDIPGPVDNKGCPYGDRDGDGISRADIADGVDACGPTFTLAREQSAARVAPPPWPSVAAPSAGGSRLLGAGPALRFGASRLAVFTPDGDASPGSVTITDGRDHLCAVVVSGAGGRVRSLCYDRTGDRWRAR